MTTSPYSQRVIKQGSTFTEDVPASIAQSLGLTDLVGVTVASSIVTNDAVEHHLVVTIPDTSVLTFNISSATAGWKIGDANWDIKFTLLSGRVIYTDTIPVKIIKHFTS